MAKQTIKWLGNSGKEYTYWVYNIGTSFKESPANYVFAKETKPSALQPIYIGETGDISERFDNHLKMPCILNNGATHVCVRKTNDDKKARCKEESDLIENYHPVCNGQ